MAKYINKFNNQGEYESQIFSLDYPSINYIESGDTVVWNETMPRYKFLLTDTRGNKKGIAWDSANTEVTQTDLSNLGVSVRDIYELTVDSGVTKIGDYFLYYYKPYTVTNIMSGVTEIGNQGFKPNQGYTDMSKVPNVTKLNQESVKLQSFYDIPSGVTSIGTNSVSIADTSTDYTSGLTISSNISEILGRPLGNAFVSRYIFESTTPPSISNLSNIFNNYGGAAMDVFVPDSSVTDYKNSFSGRSSQIFSINDMPTSGYSLIITDFDDNIVFEVPQILNSNESETLSSFYLPHTSIIGNNKKTLQIGEGITSMSSNFIYGDWYHKLSDTVFDDVILPSTIKYFSGRYDNSRHLQTKHINMPSGLTNSYYFCNGNTVLRSVSIEDGLTNIGDGAFYNCSSLSSITIPNSVTSIGTESFYNCRGLSSINIPSGVTSVGTESFSNCSSLTSITFTQTTPPTLGTNVFYGTNFPIYVPAESVEAYKAANNWSAYADRIQAIPNS